MLLDNIPHVVYRFLLTFGLGFLLTAGPVSAGMYEELLQVVDENDAAQLRELLKQGGDPNTVDRDGNSLLMLAARDGREDVFKVLLETRVKINARNRGGETALMLAAIQGHTEIAKRLVFNGAQVDFRGWNPLLYAATGGKDDIVLLLLNVGADINARSENGTTPLMMAVRGAHLSTVKLLLERGANPNLKNERGETALMWAMDHGHTQIGTLLMERGAKD